MKIGAAIATGGEREQRAATRGLMPTAPPRKLAGIFAGLLAPERTKQRVDECAHPDEVVARECARNRLTWAALARLGVAEGTELALDFFFQTAGADADRELAAFLDAEAGYAVVIEKDGVTGRTSPMPIGPTALDQWVESMLHAGYEHGRCAFSGWTATVVRPARS
jgi:hypothetical protein